MSTQTVAFLIKRIREERGWSQSRAAEAAGLSHSTVSRWEAGTRIPTKQMMSIYLEALGATEAQRARVSLAMGFGHPLDERATAITDVLADPAVELDHRNHLDQLLNIGSSYAQLVRAGPLSR